MVLIFSLQVVIQELQKTNSQLHIHNPLKLSTL